ncbi:MAG: sigma-54-dependent Fis family transcriptional regulator [Deltaproteobacteria bacterium]|nr:MAG: sigma-54-dependent Fis family transcriptional regulator [Deltaproteobacteria bacterium]
MAKRILIVDDEVSILDALGGILEDEGFEPVRAQNGEDALARLSEAAPDLVLLDVWMPPGIDGLEVLRRIKLDYPFLPVVIMSGHGTVETAVKATKLGAHDFIEKPLSLEKIVLTINNTLDYSRLEEENLLLRQRVGRKPELTGQSEAMLELKRQIVLVAPTSAWVLIKGENGVGKELVSHAIHRQSKRAARPLIEVNCAAIPEELIESELFGHEKGSFTGATTMRRGKFDLANEGTLFLDEIGDMSFKTQAKILRILQEQKFERVGGTKTINVDVRVIAASNKNLEEEIKKGNFREDLYHRLNVVPIEMPPLRERLSDIPLLVKEFLSEFASDGGLRRKEISDGALQLLAAYHWPGNVRELRNVVERLVIMSPGALISEKDVSSSIRGAKAVEKKAGDMFAFETFKDAKAHFEREFILHKLVENDGNISQTAEKIGLERSHLHRKMKALDLDSVKSGQ